MKKYIKKTYEPIVNLEGEIWKPVIGYNGIYEVSNMGRVKSLNYLGHGVTKLLKPANCRGYLYVVLFKDGKSKTCRVHRLVYEDFYGSIPKYNGFGDGNTIYEINHKDENKSNNRLDNLELITHTENVNYGTGMSRNPMFKLNNKNSKTVYQYTKEGVLVKVWPSAHECMRNGFLQGCVCDCCRHVYGRNKKGRIYKGYIWSYVPLENTTK